ncbi:MAG TPA: hypothetical protein VF541_05420 [Longimicrobium sp.]
MPNVARAVFHDGKIELVDQIDAPEGARLLVTVVTEEDEEKAFWLAASLPAMRALWDNEEDDIYEQLLEE